MRFARGVEAMAKKKNGSNGGGGGRKPNGKGKTLHERLDDIEKLLKAHSLDLRNLKNGLAFLRQSVDVRFDGIDARLDAHDARFKRIEDHLGIGPPPEE